MTEGIGRSTRLLAAIAVSAALCVVLAACGGGKSDTGKSAGGSAAPPSQVEQAAITVKATILPTDVKPEKPFSCTKDGKGEEVTHGPNLSTNLAEATVARSSKGVCAVFTFPKGTDRYPSGSQAIQLTFYRHGDTSASLEQRTSGELRHNVQISVYSAPVLKDGRYELSTSVPMNGSDGSAVTAGRLGAAGQVVSVLVTEPKLPAWVLDRDTVWRVKYV